MTDKQVIIDEIDVSDCNYWKGYCRIASLCDYPGHLCEVTPNCYFKQLKRKEQECENNKIAYQMELDIYNQECLNLQEELKAKEQECKELKNEKIKLIETNFEQKCKIQKLIDENATKEVIYKINGKCAKTVANKVKEIASIIEGKDCKYSRYKQALDDIEKKCLNYQTCLIVLKKDILDIIHRAKE